MRRLLLLLLLVGTYHSLKGQDSQVDQQAIYLQFNTLLVYSNYTINYESKKVFSGIEKHSLRVSLGAGSWTTNAFNKNTGFILNYGFTYQFGLRKHLLELSFKLQSHFDRGLKNQFLVPIGLTYRPFIGYRYQPTSTNFFLRVGTGWREVFQVGLGLKL